MHRHTGYAKVCPKQYRLLSKRISQVSQRLPCACDFQTRLRLSMFALLISSMLLLLCQAYRLPPWVLNGVEPPWRFQNATDLGNSYALRKPVVKKYKVGMPCVCSHSYTDTYSEIVYRSIHLKHFAMLNELVDGSRRDKRHRWFILMDMPKHNVDIYLTPLDSLLCMDIDNVKGPQQFVYRRNDTDIGFIGTGKYLSILYEGKRATIPKAIHSLSMSSPLLLDNQYSGDPRPVMEELSPDLIAEEIGEAVPLPWLQMRTRSVLWFPIA
eukprot:Blabericola_migrator_1__838@NODE_1206_length_5110_cov_47_888757_g818_i0_p4_GENE_NODE_1206_length_5110_cov_47_888757_g818_i0NODE_1206_length_5110_cov_47_888757_g818_i0_p4_ORF_typecomplete_len268_score14_29_NODE_1206_length_5110_cov_47_888757_g818_i023023105